MKGRKCNQASTEQSNLSKLFMKERSTHAGNVNTWQLQCSKDDLTTHQQAIHEGKMYPCREFDHLATSKGDLTQHQQFIHEENNY